MTRRRRLLLWLLFAVLSLTGRVWSLAEKDIVVKNVPLRVPVGRYVFVSPSEDLRIRVAPGDSCSVQVVQSDEDGPVGSVRPGRLQPSNFPCGFGLGSVSYTHFGSRIAPLLDRVRLLVKYDTENETLIVPLVLVVTVLPTPFEIAVKVASLTVSRIGGESQSIGTDTLNFEVGDGVCRVRVQTEIHQLPRYGELVGDVPTQLTSCEAFLGGDIRYRHGGNHRSPNRDYIPMLVEVSDSRGHVVKKEWFQLPVRIQDGVENSAPQPTFASDLRLDVNQFIMTAITPAVLAAEDLESDSGLLLFNMRTFLGPEEGYFVSTDDRRLPATSFYQKDVQALKIAYVPPTQGSEERRVFRIELEVVDPEGAASDPFSLMIIVKPTNTISPLVIKNKGLTLFEGKSKKMVHSLLISDEDNRDDVSLTVVDGLRHGSLLVDGSETDSFAIGDLDQGLVVYRHGGSSTITDNIVFKMSDGEHEVEFLFPVTIYPDDDEPPLLNVNTGLSTQKGEDSQVTSRHLSATDVDSDDTTILYELLPPFPEHGTLILKQPEKPPESFRWEYREGVFEREVTKWTQTDLQEGRLFYRHTGDHVTEVTTDSVYFRLSDENNPPNESGINEFTIKIMPVDDIAPERSPEATLHLLVEEFQLTEITKLELRYRDLDTKEKDLRYRITKAPHDTDEANAMSPGMVVRVDNPDVEITEFTQAEVNHHKIAYKPPPIELGIVPRIIQFHFDVSDAGSNVLPDQVFTILVQPVDNKPPTVLNRGLSVVEKGFVDIRTEDLDATDTDTPSDELSFVIVKTPVYGRVRVGSDELNEDDFFKREDIVNGRVRYENIGGSSRKTDRIDIEVCDGVHRVPITVRIHIKPLSEEPQGLQKRPGTLNVYLSVNEGGKVLLGGHAFKVQNVNLEKGAVEFVLTHAPKQGSVQNNGLKTNRFTREDVLKRRVFYVHSGSETGERGSSDMFQLSLVERSGSVKTDDVLVQVKIEPVDSVAPRVAVGPPLQVREGGKAAITRNYLSATDVDTNDEDILCSIDVQPSHGYVENVSPAPGSERVRAGVPVSAFTIGEVMSGWINYVQSIHRGFEPLEDNFTFICSDGVNVSPKSKLNVQIYPTNDEMPEIAADEMFVVEGGDVSLDTLVAQVTDMDRPPDQLAFRIKKHPMHGRIVTAHSVVVDSFTKADVTPPSFIVYRHDDSETTSDYFELYVSDGMHQSSGRISVTIEPVDDETPRLVVNTGLDVGVGEAKTITNRVLKAEDVDSEESALVYSIIQPPKHGYLQYLNASSYRPQRNLSLGSNFTQQDIDRGLLVYRHTGVPGVRDLIKFDVTDGSNPLIDQFFWVTVESVDAVYPEVVNRGVRLPEGGKVILTTSTLSTTDLNSDDELLRFTVTKSPSKGHLESTDAPGVILRTFTQMQLAGNKICYVHTSKDESKLDSFEFEVSDGRNSVFRTFRISITDVDNKKPVLFIYRLRLREGTERLITPFELRADDMDTSDRNIQFKVVHKPIHGKLIYGRSREANAFSMADLNDNRVLYVHDGSDTARDNFTFVVSDGTHRDFYVHPNVQEATREPQMFPVEVVPVDNSAPQITVNKGAFALSHLDSSRRLGYRLSGDVLRATDADSVDARLKFVVTVFPSHGIIVNRAVGNRSVVEFTQADLDNADVFYMLHQKANVTRDSFVFKVVDEGKNELRNQKFELRWSWISLAQDAYSVKEPDGYLTVTLRRRGYLGETAFVSISARNLTARQGTDFSGHYSRQVQFNPGQAEAVWKLRILDDGLFERREEFVVVLDQAFMTATESPEKATVTIYDPEDEPSVSLLGKNETVREDQGHLFLAIKRTGDSSVDMAVLCVTSSGTAQGSRPSPLRSYSDYVERPVEPGSLVRFRAGEDTKMCRVILIDDSLYEEAENFTVSLTGPVNGKIAGNDTTVITILPDPKDVPFFYFEESSYQVEESVGSFEVTVLREGPDLSLTSSVMVRSKPASPPSAQAGNDYIAVGHLLHFPVGSTAQTVEVIILDDYGHPVLEFAESFQLVLRAPVNGTLGNPQSAVVTINDSLSDLPKMFFQEEAYVVNEEVGTLAVSVLRTGDLKHASSVRCYTRQGTARVDLDFEERSNADESLIVFQPGDREKQCQLVIKNDNIREGSEELRVLLGTPRSTSAGTALLGEPNVISVRIQDDADQPMIKFQQTRLMVKEPRNPDDVINLVIPVVRFGDTTGKSVVKVYTRDGTAVAGEDYVPLSQDVVLHPHVNETLVTVQILYDDIKEHKEAFTLHMKEDMNRIAEVRDSKAIVYIEDVKFLPAVTFPSEPVVVSLRDYDDADRVAGRPIHGYPLCCISSCNAKHPDYLRTGPICSKEGINDSLTEFRWLVASPDDSFDLKDIQSKAFFAPVRAITLDSVYFSAGSRVQCAARAVNTDGDVGLEVQSVPVTISMEEGLCRPSADDYVGAEPFTARLRYTGTNDPKAPNKIQITVLIPHRDGLLPAVSTRPLSNFEFALSPSSLRVGLHKCSNLVDADESFTPDGFITESIKSSHLFAGDAEPYQYSKEMRSLKTLRFYKSLDLESCLWNLTAYYTLSELVSDCGGAINHDGQALNLVQSYVSVSVPLYVSYILHSTAAVGGWQHSDMVTELKISFVYNTAILWDHGISTHVDSHLNGSIYPTGMRINDQGQLVVRFRTVSGFHGQYILESRGLRKMSYVTSEEQPDLTFTLRLIRSDKTFNEAQQEWELTSDVAVKDYSGTYKINLVPCTVREGADYSDPPRCNPQDPVPFELPIHFQQVSDPVPTQFSLDTQFHITRRRDLWLSEESANLSDDVDVSFVRGDKIYGKIMISPLQSLGHSFTLFIEKCFLCTGVDGYIPRYDPENGDYGCIADSENLRYVIKIIDKEAPNTIAPHLHEAHFNATLVSDSVDDDLVQIKSDPGADGFYFLSDPLFKVASGTLWFIHCIYTLRGKEGGNRRFGKRHVSSSDALDHVISKRSMLADAESIGKNGRGTNMHQIVLSSAMKQTGTYEMGSNAESPATWPVLLVVPLVLVGALVTGTVAAYVICRRRRSSASLSSATSGNRVVTVCCAGGKSHVHASGYMPNTEFAGTEV